MKMIKHLRSELMSDNIHPDLWVWGSGKYPGTMLGYFRADHDGCSWWSTANLVNNGLYTEALNKESAMVLASFKEAFKSRAEMAGWCRDHAKRTADDTEFDAFLELEHGYYWFHMITRPGDYNLYLYTFSRKAMGEKSA